MSEIVEKCSAYVFGIDLGTTNTAIATYRSGGPEVIRIEGAKTMPSVVSVQKSGDVLVGMSARSRNLIDPENTVASVKRHMGTDWKKKFEGIPDKEYTPIDVSAEILKMLADHVHASEGNDYGGKPRFVCICVPANFTDAQRKATAEAGAAAGLEVLSLIEEPVAAAYAYAVEKSRDQTILIYDLGGGTFDVSILKVNSGEDKTKKFSVLAKEGIQRLGGDDIDTLLVEDIAKKFEEQSSLALLDTEKDQGISPRKVKEAQQKLLESVIQAKHDLSDAESTKMDIPNLVSDEGGQAHHIDDLEITRDRLEDLIRPLISLTRDSVEAALKSADLEIDDIDRILLVGGSTKIPLVKTMLKEFFGRDPYSDTDPDTAIARGAAILGATLLLPDPEVRRPEDDVPAFIIEKHDIVSHYLGIETVGGVFSCLLKKGADIEPGKPTVAESGYTTPRNDMTELNIRVYQAPEDTRFVTDEGVVCIGEFYLKGIPAKPAREEIIEVKFEINDQNVLSVQASSSSSNQLEVLALTTGAPVVVKVDKAEDVPEEEKAEDEETPASEEPEDDPPEEDVPEEEDPTEADTEDG